MIIAVMAARLQDLRQLVSENGNRPCMIVEFLRRFGVVGAFHERALGTEPDAIQRDLVAKLRHNVDDLLDLVLAQASAAGAIRAGLSATDLRLINRMIVAAAMMPDMEREVAWNRSLAFVLSGISDGNREFLQQVAS